MITANEIRIGNWYKHLPVWSYRNEDLKEFYFQWEDRDWYAVGECTLNLQSIEAIPLTPELLLKCGFEKETPDDKYGEVYIKEGFGFILRKVNFGKPMTPDYGFALELLKGDIWTTIIKRIPYLHQLQNIYQVFTQTELTVNL